MFVEGETACLVMEQVTGRLAKELGLVVDRQRLDPGMPGAASGSACILREGAAGSREVRIAWSRPAEVAMSPIRTVAQTERGLEMTCQGHGLVVAWPVRLPTDGDWSVEISARIAGRE